LRVSTAAFRFAAASALRLAAGVISCRMSM
jgi:hypothetical protein